MSAPIPYAPLQYPEEPTLIYAGQQTIGTAHKFQVDSSNPTQYASEKSADVTTFWMGAAIARQGSSFVLASSGNVSTLAIGVATLGAPPGQPEMVQLYGLITIEDWTLTTGAPSLIPGANYYLQVVRGTLSTAPAGPLSQLVGIALTAKTMEIVAGGGIGSALVSGGSNTLGMSNLGNTSGTTGVVSGSAIEMIFAGGNNITLSQSLNGASGTITIQAAAGSDIAGVQTFGMSNLGHTSGTSGVVAGSAVEFILVGGNNVTLSQSINGSSATITISAFNQSTQTQNLFDLTLSGNTSGALGLVSSGTLTLAGGNNITLSQAGNAITISGPNTSSQTVQTQNVVDVTLSGNTSGVLALISSGTLTLAGGNNITLSQVGNAVTISAFTQTAGSDSIGMSNLGNTSGTTGVASGNQVRFVFAGGNNITLSQSLNGASGTITVNGPNIAIALQTGGISNLGNTSGTSGVVTGPSIEVVFAGGNNITLSQSINGSSATITISAFNQTVQTQNLIDVTLSGNTSGTLALISSGTLTLAGGNRITLSQVGNAVTISGDSQSVQTQNVVDLSLSGNTTGTLALISSGTAILAGGNNITLSQNGQSITISGANAAASGTVVSGIGVSTGGNTTGNTGTTVGTIVFVGGNNITLNQSTAAGSLATIAISQGRPIGVSTLGNTSGATGVVTNQIVFVGSNGITLRQSNAGIIGNQSATITISGPGTVFGSILDITLAGNLAGTLANISTGTFVLAGGNHITLSQNGNSVTISGETPLAQNFAGGNFTGVNANVSTGALSWAGGNNITLSQNGQTVTISGGISGIQDIILGGNATGTAANISTGTFTLAGGNNITISGDGGNGLTIIGASQTVQTQNLFDLTLGGNTLGVMALISSGTMTLAGGNGLTLSQAGNAVTAFVQTYLNELLLMGG